MLEEEELELLEDLRLDEELLAGLVVVVLALVVADVVAWLVLEVTDTLVVLDVVVLEVVVLAVVVAAVVVVVVEPLEDEEELAAMQSEIDRQSAPATQEPGRAQLGQLAVHTVELPCSVSSK